MIYLLDTNICSAWLRHGGRLTHRFLQHNGGLAISTVALGELYVWALKRGRSDALLQSIENDLLADVKVLDFDRSCARRFGAIRSEMLAIGIVVNPVDLMIAAVALEYDLTLVTHNTKHFAPVPKLRIEDWLT